MRGWRVVEGDPGGQVAGITVAVMRVPVGVPITARGGMCPVCRYIVVPGHDGFRTISSGGSVGRGSGVETADLWERLPGPNPERSCAVPGARPGTGAAQRRGPRKIRYAAAEEYFCNLY